MTCASSTEEPWASGAGREGAPPPAPAAAATTPHHRPPGAGRVAPAASPRSPSSKRAAARLAVFTAQRPVLSSPRTRMAAPSPSTSHHTPCSTLVNAVPPRARAGPTIVPEIATPRVVPVWRPAEASEVATPAIERGIPETAVLVIGGVTVRGKSPKNRRAAGSGDPRWGPSTPAGPPDAL